MTQTTQRGGQGYFATSISMKLMGQTVADAVSIRMVAAGTEGKNAKAPPVPEKTAVGICPVRMGRSHDAPGVNWKAAYHATPAALLTPM